MGSIPHPRAKNTAQGAYDDVGQLPTLAGEVYLAAPITTYRSGQYDCALRWLRTNYPHATIVSARDAFRDRVDWLARWRGVLSRCAALVFITDGEDFIGRGVDGEITFARARPILVLMLNGAGRLVPYHHLSFTPPNAGDWQRYRRVTVKGVRRGT